MVICTMYVEVGDTIVLFGIWNHVELVEYSTIAVGTYDEIIRSYGDRFDPLKEAISLEYKGRIWGNLDACANLYCIVSNDETGTRKELHLS